MILISILLIVTQETMCGKSVFYKRESHSIVACFTKRFSDSTVTIVKTTYVEKFLDSARYKSYNKVELTHSGCRLAYGAELYKTAVDQEIVSELKERIRDFEEERMRN